MSMTSSADAAKAVAADDARRPIPPRGHVSGAIDVDGDETGFTTLENDFNDDNEKVATEFSDDGMVGYTVAHSSSSSSAAAALANRRLEIEQLTASLPVGTPRGVVTFLYYVPLFPQLCNEFGYRSIGVFTAVYFLVKGIMVHLVNAVQLPLYKDVFHVDSLTYQRLGNVTLMAWGMKPAIGLISDAFPIKGYHKKYYMLGACVASAVLVFSVLLFPETERGATMAAVALLGVNYAMATLDLLAEGTYSTLLALKPAVGPALVSYVWGSAMAGGTIAALVEGPLADSGAPRAALLLAVPIAVLVAYPIHSNWLMESPAAPYHRIAAHASTAAAVEGQPLEGLDDTTPSRADALSTSVSPIVPKTFFGVVTIFINRQLLEHWEISLYGIAVAVGAVILAFASTIGGPVAQLVLSVIVTVVLSTLSFFALPPVIAKANVFMFLKEVLYVQIPGVLDYFFTADERCVPGGPHFSYSYYQTTTSVVGYAAGGLGVVMFNTWLSKASLRSAFWSTTTLKVIASFFDVVLVLRWNVALAIPDSVMFMLGDAVVGNVCTMLDFMPAVILTSRLCPRGMEATMYAVLAGFSNFGQTISRTTGLLLTDAFGVVAEESNVAGSDASASLRRGCNYDHAPALIMLCHCFLPLLVIPLSIALVPRMRADENLLATDQPHVVASEGRDRGGVAAI